MSTHEKLILDWPEGVTSAYTEWHRGGQNLAMGDYSRRPPAPAPAGWEGPTGSDWHDWIGKVVVVWDKCELHEVGHSRLRYLSGRKEDGVWYTTSGGFWDYCRPLTRAESGDVTP